MNNKTNSANYKYSPLGKIPEDWEVKKIEDVAFIQGGYAFDSKKFKDIGAYQIIKMSNLHDNILDLSRSQSFIDEISEQEKEFELKNGDIIITLTGTNGKRDYGYSYQITNEKNLLLNQRVARIVSINVDSRFLYYSIKSIRFLNQFYFSARGGTGNQTNVGTGDVSALKLILPSLDEQISIASCLTTWDEAIQSTTHLIAQKALQKRWLSQQLFTMKKRLKGFSNEWTFMRFNEIYSQVKEKAGDRKLLALSVTKNGIVSQAEYFNKDI